MAGVLNNTARRITLNYKTKRGMMIKYVIHPLEIKEIPKEHWSLIKKGPVVKAWIDKGDLAVGGKRKIILPDDFEPEPEQTEEELAELEAAETEAEKLAEEEANDTASKTGS